MADKYVFENEDSDDQKAEEEEQPPWLRETHGLVLSSILARNLFRAPGSGLS